MAMVAVTTADRTVGEDLVEEMGVAMTAEGSTVAVKVAGAGVEVTTVVMTAAVGQARERVEAAKAAGMAVALVAAGFGLRMSGLGRISHR